MDFRYQSRFGIRVIGRCVQDMDGGGNGTEKNFRPVYRIIILYMNQINPRVWK